MSPPASSGRNESLVTSERAPHCAATTRRGRRSAASLPGQTRALHWGRRRILSATSAASCCSLGFHGLTAGRWDKRVGTGDSRGRRERTHKIRLICNESLVPSERTPHCAATTRRGPAAQRPYQAKHVLPIGGEGESSLLPLLPPVEALVFIAAPNQTGKRGIVWFHLTRLICNESLVTSERAPHCAATTRRGRRSAASLPGQTRTAVLGIGSAA